MPIADLLDEQDRAWLDWRWDWLAQRIGIDRIRAAEVFGSADSFVRTNRAISEELMQELAQQVAARLGFGNWQVAIVVYTGDTVEQIEQFDLAYQTARQQPNVLTAVIHLDEYDAPQRAVLNLVRSLAGAYLEQKGWIDLDAPGTKADCELAAVILGGGVLLANNAIITEQGFSGGLEVFRTERAMDMSEQMFGYALARFAHVREENPPSWLRLLRADPRSYCDRCLAELDHSPPPKDAPKPPNVMDTWEQVDAAVDANEEDQESWSEEDFVPPNPKDFDANLTPVYCRACAYNVAHLPPGDCPECGKPFDPDDLRTVTLDKPMLISEPVHRTMELFKKLIMRFFIVFFLLAIVAAGIIFLGTILGLTPNP